MILQNDDSPELGMHLLWIFDAYITSYGPGHHSSLNEFIIFLYDLKTTCEIPI